MTELFCGETGYQTPKLDTRAAIFKDNKILLVHEKNGTWSLPGGWRLTVESEPYFKKERPTALELRKGLYAPWFEVECEDGRLHLAFHESWALRLVCWAVAALAVAGMVAARVLAPNTGASIAPGVIALALLFWDFTRERRLMTAVSRFVREKILEEQAQ